MLRRWLLIGLGLVLWGTLIASCTGPSPTRPSTDPSGQPGDRPQRVYLVQVGMSEEKPAADRIAADALDWWRDLPPSERPWPLEGDDTLPVEVEWQAPLYRVRVGPFSSRSRAEAVLDAVQSRFSDAFIAPRRVSPPS